MHGVAAEELLHFAALAALRAHAYGLPGNALRQLLLHRDVVVSVIAVDVKGVQSLQQFLVLRGYFATLDLHGDAFTLQHSPEALSSVVARAGLPHPSRRVSLDEVVLAVDVCPLAGFAEIEGLAKQALVPGPLDVGFSAGSAADVAVLPAFLLGGHQASYDSVGISPVFAAQGTGNRLSRTHFVLCPVFDTVAMHGPSAAHFAPCRYVFFDQIVLTDRTRVSFLDHDFVHFGFAAVVLPSHRYSIVPVLPFLYGLSSSYEPVDFELCVS